MRWLAKRVLRREVLELEDGTAVYYPDRVAGPGYLLNGGQRRRLEGYVTPIAGVFIAFFAVFFGPPRNILEAWLVGFTGDTYYAMLLALGLTVCAMLFFLWLAQVGKRRFLGELDRRDPAIWEEDLKRLSTASEAAGGSGFLLFFIVVSASGWLLGHMMDGVLMLVIEP